MENMLEKSGNFVSPEKWEPCYSTDRWPWTESHELEGLRAYQRAWSQGHTSR